MLLKLSFIVVAAYLLHPNRAVARMHGVFRSSIFHLYLEPSFETQPNHLKAGFDEYF